MAEYTGRKVAVGIAREATRGTAETAVDYWINHLDQSFYPRAEKALNESALGVLHTNNDSDTMHQWAEGTLEGKLGDQSMGLLLYAAMGTLSTTTHADASGAVRTHAISFDQSNSPQSLTVFKKSPNKTEAFPLAMITSFEITGELGRWVQFSAELTSKKGVTSTVSVARINENEFKPKSATVKLAANTAGLAGATALGTVQSFRLTINRNVERDHQLNQEDPYDISVRGIEVNGEFVMRYDADTYEAAFLADTKYALQLALTNTDVTIGTSANPSLTFTLPKVSLDNWEPDEGLDDKVNQTIGFQGLYDTTSASALTASINNLVTSYT